MEDSGRAFFYLKNKALIWYRRNHNKCMNAYNNYDEGEGR